MVQCWTWWRHQMETFSALLAICAGNSLVPGEFPAQMPVTRSFDVFFDLRLNKQLCKQSWGWWFETPACPLWCHCNETESSMINMSIPWLLMFWLVHQIISIHDIDCIKLNGLSITRGKDFNYLPNVGVKDGYKMQILYIFMFPNINPAG